MSRPADNDAGGIAVLKRVDAAGQMTDLAQDLLPLDSYPFFAASGETRCSDPSTRAEVLVAFTQDSDTKLRLLEMDASGSLSVTKEDIVAPRVAAAGQFDGRWITVAETASYLWTVYELEWDASGLSRTRPLLGRDPSTGLIHPYAQRLPERRAPES